MKNKFGFLAWTKWKVVVVIFLFILGFVFRVIKWINFDRFAGDEGIQLIVTDHLFRYGDLPVGGEISALDANNQYIIHNSPLGYYLLSFQYLLGFLTPEGYTYFNLIKNLITALFLYKTSELLFSKQAAIFTLIFALLTPTMLTFSSWPSQPTNAIFFESIAIYLFTFFITTRKKKYFIFSFLITLLATHMYPPMYLLFPIKFALFIYYIKKSPINEKNLLTLFTGLIFTYIPFVIIEISKNWINTRTIYAFLTETESPYQLGDILGRLIINLSQPLSFISYQLFENYYWLLFIIVTLLTYIWLIMSGRVNKNIFLLLGLFIVFPVLVMTFYITDESAIAGNAYLTILIPYLYIFSGGLLTYIPSKIITFLLIVTLSLSFIRLTPVELQSNGLPNLNDLRYTTQTLLDHAKKIDLQPVDIELYAISRGDKWNWEGSIYWYLLERQTNEKLVSIDFETSKPQRLNKNTPNLVYVICHDIPMGDIYKYCEKVFLEADEGIYQSNYILSDKLYEGRSAILVMAKN